VTPAELSTLDLRESGGDCLLRVKATPRASRSEAAGVANGALRLRIQAPPVEGAANDKARDFLAALIGCSRSAVSLERGQSGRDKTFRIQGFTAEALRSALSRRP
jgi:uncharacterized protein (TIGR00251 family)